MKNKKIVILLALFFFMLSTWPNLLHASEALLEKGIEQYKSENYEEAVDILVNARKQQPDSSVAAFYLGISYKQLREYRLAEKHLRDSIQLTPPVKDAYLELAEVLFVLDQLNEAEGWALKSEQEGIKTANAVFMRGLILAKRDRTEEAIAAFNKAKGLDKALSQSADFQIAMAQIKKQSFEDARKSFSAIQKIDPTSELASFAKEYEKSLTRTLDMYKPWRFSFGVAYQYDDNVVLKPTTDIPGVDITGERDSSIIATLGVVFSPRLKGPFFLNCQYNLYTDTYFATNSHNLVTHTISVNPGVNFQKGFVSSPVSYSHIWVHGGEYMSVLSLKPAVQFAFNPSNIGRISLGYEKESFSRPLSTVMKTETATSSALQRVIFTPLLKAAVCSMRCTNLPMIIRTGKTGTTQATGSALGCCCPPLYGKRTLSFPEMFFCRTIIIHIPCSKKRGETIHIPYQQPL